MTSPNDPQKESLRDRLSNRFSRDERGRYLDAEAQHTRNVSWIFYGLIVVIVVIIVGGLAFGYWESNLKPVASVSGSDVSRGQLEDRTKLVQFRAERAAEQTAEALAAGTIDSDLANRRFSTADALALATDAEVLTELVDLLYKEQLAGDEEVALTADELQAAVEADGTFDAVRQIDAVIVSTDELDQGFPATEASLADARERAAAAAEDLAAGVDPAEVAETHGPAQHQSAWITYEDLANTDWADLVFAAEEGDVTTPVEDEIGYQLMALVTGTLDEQPDPGFVEAVNDEVGEDIHRRSVELEALADKLERHVTDQALATEYEHVRLAEIFIERSAAGGDDSVGEARASHILYQPETPLDEEGEPTALADLAPDDPAWDAAEAEAQAAADELAAIEDVDERRAAFAERAMAESDGPSGPDGGDLGWFAREMMVQPFSDAIWENLDPASGDILGPVRTDFGWHVILFDGFRSSLDVRVSDVQAALAEEGADFATVAREYSDGPEAADGGDTGWHVQEFLDDDVVVALSTVEIGEPTEPVDGGDGYRIFQKLEQAARPLDEEDAAEVRASAFGDWYDERYFAALDDGSVSIDESIYE